MRLIDAYALEKFLADAEMEATRKRKYVFASALNTICGNVKNFPTIEPEREKGKWIFATNFPDGKSCYVCKDCGAKLDSMYPNFCPNCGADMRGEEDDSV